MQVDAEPGVVRGKVGTTRPRNTSKAWAGFILKLSAALRGMEEDQFLILNKKRSNRYVQFCCQGSFGMRMETTSNNYLKKHLSAEEIATLVDLKWLPPTSGADATPEDDPDGSSNFYFDSELPIDYDALAGVAVHTCSAVLNVTHPGLLEYNCFDRAGNPIALDGLGLKRTAHAKPVEDEKSLPQRLLETIKEETHIQNLSIDADGDIDGITYGNLSVNIRLLSDEPFVKFYSVLVRDVEETQGLLQRLNELNVNSGHMHLVAKNGVILVMKDVLIRPYVEEHIQYSLQYFCQVGEGIHDMLNAEFGAASSVEQSNLKH